MNDENRHKLKRSDLGEDVKRQVRQRCGFGCVICGSAIIQYEHFDPPFADATEHRTEGITLLCGGCHDKVTRGVWSKDKVRRCNAKPKSMDVRPHHALDLAAPIRIAVGGSLFLGNGPLVMVDGRTILGLTEVNGHPVLNAEFRDGSGQVCLEVIANELRIARGAWDATILGAQITIRSGPGSIVFDGTLHPPSGLYVRHIDVQCGPYRFRSDNTLGVSIYNGDTRVFANNNLALVTSGSVQLNTAKATIGPGVALIPFPIREFSRLARLGNFDELLARLYAPTIRVSKIVKEAANTLPIKWQVSASDHSFETQVLDDRAKAIEAAQAKAISMPSTLVVAVADDGSHEVPQPMRNTAEARKERGRKRRPTSG